MRRILSFALFSIVITAASAHAAPAGILSGLVVDAKGVPVPAARVSWQTADGTRPHALHTDAQGRFRLDSLRPGLYELRAEAAGMWSDWEHNLLVKAGFESTITLRMSRNTPPKAEIAARRLEGRLREWIIPAEDAAPQEMAVDSSGRVWVTLTAVNQLGRLDPVTGQWKFFSIPTQSSGLHGLVPDRNGYIWFAENTAGKIGRVDGRTGTVAEFAIPGVKDPNTPALAANGSLWFTAESTNAIMRLDTQSSEISSFPLPTRDAKPLGLAPGPDGALWFYESASNKLGRLDAATGAIVEFAAPLGNTRLHGLAMIGRTIYFTDFGGGRLGAFDMDSKSFRSWPSPAGSASQPYGIAADREGIVWYSDINANTVVRFDPRTESLQSHAISSANSRVQSMARDAQGRIWLAFSATNRVAVIE